MSGLDAARQPNSTTSDEQGQPHQTHCLSSQAVHIFQHEDSHQPTLSLNFSSLSGADDGLGNHVTHHIDVHHSRDSLMDDLHPVGDHPKLDEMTMLEAVNPPDTHHEDSRESRDDPDIKRVKVSYTSIYHPFNHPSTMYVGILHLVLLWLVPCMGRFSNVVFLAAYQLATHWQEC